MAATGKQPGGRRVVATGGRTALVGQVTLTDEDSRTMQTPGDGFDQCYNA